MKTWEKNIRQVLPYIPGEQPKQADIIKLNTNENPYPPSPRVAETLEQFQTGELRLYPDPDSNILVEALADFYQIDRSRIFVGVGSDDVLAVSFLTFFNSGKPVLFPDITYSFYDVWARLFQIPFEQIPLDGEFQIRKSDYFRENGGVVFPNPNATTGILMGLPEIEDIISHNQDVVVIVDEAYIDFGGISAFPLLDKYDNLLIIQTVSKSRALAGLRVGYAFGSPQLISYLNDVRNSFNSYTMNRLTQTLGAAAVRDREYFERTNALIIATRERIKRELKQLGFSFQDSKSNFLFVTHPSVKAGVIYESLRAAGIYVRHFSKPERISDYLRIAVGTDQEMDCLLIKLKEILQQHGDLHGNIGECQ